jgi:hypothetical protein
MRRKPDIWYYTVKREGQVGELKLNLVEVTIPWGTLKLIQKNLKRVQMASMFIDLSRLMMFTRIC